MLRSEVPGMADVSVDQLQAYVGTIAEHIPQLDVEVAKRLQMSGVLQWPRVDRIEADGLAQLENRFACCCVIACSEEAQLLSDYRSAAHMLSENSIECLDHARSGECLLQLLGAARAEANGKLHVGRQRIRDVPDRFAVGRRL